MSKNMLVLSLAMLLSGSRYYALFYGRDKGAPGQLKVTEAKKNMRRQIDSIYRLDFGKTQWKYTNVEINRIENEIRVMTLAKGSMKGWGVDVSTDTNLNIIQVTRLVPGYD